MSRSDIPDIRDRRPFYLYVDEFQNFATDSFATILSEARKYGLNLAVANQYISQMTDTVRNAVFGNVGTVISFRVSADDAPILSKQFEPNFEALDLLQMHNRNFVINMVIGGEKTPAFSGRTLELPPTQTDNTSHIIEYSRRMYSRDRSEVEAEINTVMKPKQSQQSKTISRPATSQPAPPQQEINASHQPELTANQPSMSAKKPDNEVTISLRGDQPTASVPDAKPKRKRTRSRRKKNTSSSTPQAQ